MSFFHEVLEEKRQIDHYLADKYRITGVQEDLSGMLLELMPPDESDNLIKLQILTAEARTYLSNLLIKQFQRDRVEKSNQDEV
ncbi:hypothetical protein NV379_04060 [Paenibacillus sp. N1-5-1-14]|uniref:hypothetical protein n=1 Tax=Paenibacillus radicibacter TaxID=2972488 RepID=UPI002158AE48|nr:hypothetical protein [Paenibacillus radicibacter]MCR8641826.1 hypothetical protein [Paenibacillus radicibacter]